MEYTNIVVELEGLLKTMKIVEGSNAGDDWWFTEEEKQSLIAVIDIVRDLIDERN